MTLKYNILWIDDQPDSIETKLADVKEYLEEDKGFDCNIQLFKSYREYIENHGADGLNNFDLLIVDYTLDDVEDPANHSGFDIIKDIRNNKIYKEVVFYSSNYQHLIDTIKSDYVEGIFTAARAEVSDKVQDIIDVLIKKVQDVNNLRGLILAEVAELDRIKNQIVKKYCEITKNEDNVLKKYIKTDVFSDFKSNLEKYNFLISEDENSHEQMELHKFIDELIYMSTKKSKTVFKIKRLHEATKLLDFTHQNYLDEVINKRNVFAHETEREDENGKYLNYPNGSRLDFTEGQCVQIRKDIKKHKKLLEEIEQKLNE